jgi:DNA transformation protein
MTVSPSYLTFVLDQLADLGAVSAKRMFGGMGLYFDGTIFGLLADDVVYFKVDDASRPLFVARGMLGLQPVASKPTLVSDGYFQLPDDVLEDAELATEWARRAITAAAAKAKARRPKRPKAR